MPRRPARPLIWMYSPEVSQRKPPPSNLRAFVNTTVFAGMFRPVEKVSVANSTWTSHTAVKRQSHMLTDVLNILTKPTTGARVHSKQPGSNVHVSIAWLSAHARLDEVFLEQDFDDLLEDGQQPAVVHAHAPLQHWQQRAHLQHHIVLRLSLFLDQGVSEDTLQDAAAAESAVQEAGR